MSIKLDKLSGKILSLTNDVSLSTLKKIIGVLEDLKTTDKSNLVNSINEILENSTSERELQERTFTLSQLYANVLADDIFTLVNQSKLIPVDSTATSIACNVPNGKYRIWTTDGSREFIIEISNGSVKNITYNCNDINYLSNVVMYEGHWNIPSTGFVFDFYESGGGYNISKFSFSDNFPVDLTPFDNLFTLHRPAQTYGVDGAVREVDRKIEMLADQIYLEQQTRDFPKVHNAFYPQISFFIANIANVNLAGGYVAGDILSTNIDDAVEQAIFNVVDDGDGNFSLTILDKGYFTTDPSGTGIVLVGGSGSIATTDLQSSLYPANTTLADLTQTPNKKAIVLSDESHNGQSSIYQSNGSVWRYIMRYGDLDIPESGNRKIICSINNINQWNTFFDYNSITAISNTKHIIRFVITNISSIANADVAMKYELVLSVTFNSQGIRSSTCQTYITTLSNSFTIQSGVYFGVDNTSGVLKVKGGNSSYFGNYEIECLSSLGEFTNFEFINNNFTAAELIRFFPQSFPITKNFQVGGFSNGLFGIAITPPVNSNAAFVIDLGFRATPTSFFTVRLSGFFSNNILDIQLLAKRAPSETPIKVYYKASDKSIYIVRSDLSNFYSDTSSISTFGWGFMTCNYFANFDNLLISSLKTSAVDVSGMTELEVS